MKFIVIFTIFLAFVVQQSFSAPLSEEEVLFEDPALAHGEPPEGDCSATKFGCCQNGVTSALGPKFKGC
eukprot:gene3396-3886_t